MTRVALGWVVLLMGAGPALADDPAPYRSNPTFYFFAPTYQAQNNNQRLALHMGASGQRVWNNGFGWSAEVGYLSPQKRVSDGGFLTLSGGLIFRPYSAGAVNGLLGAGYMSMSLGDITGVFHYGYLSGGVDVWGGGRWGIRLETRAMMYEMGDFSYLEFRIGLLN